MLWAAGACVACGGGSEAARDGGSQDAPVGDGASADVASDVYVCGPNPFNCYNVVVGGDAGSLLPDPGVIFVETAGGHLVADPTRNVVYVSMWEGTIKGISTDTGQLAWQANGPQGFPIEKLVVTDDGSKIYATGELSDWVVRWDVASRVADLIINVSTDVNGPDVQDIAIIPGSPRSVLVAMDDRFIVFDDDVPRPVQVPAGGAVRLQPDSPTSAYVLDYSIAASLATLTLSATGVQAGTPVSGLFTVGVNEFMFDGELAYGDNGQVVDPRKGVLMGMYGPGGVAVDRSGNRAYVFPPPVFNVWEMFVDEYNRTGFTRLRSLKLSLQASSGGSLVRTANGTLALGSNASLHSGYHGVILIKPEAWSAASAP